MHRRPHSLTRWHALLACTAALFLLWSFRVNVDRGRWKVLFTLAPLQPDPPKDPACRCITDSLPNPDAAGLTVRKPSSRPPEGDVLWVPGSLEPEISIIMSYKGHYEDCFKALRSVVETTPHHIAYELVLLDDASEDAKDGPNWLVDRVRGPGVKHLRNAVNLEFLRANNVAFEQVHCGARFVVLLNNDVIVQAGWLESLRNTFLQHENVGFVGSKLVYMNGVLQEAGAIVFREASAANYGRYEDPQRPEFNYVREVDYCSGAAIMVDVEQICRRRGRRDLLFDQRYAPAYYEDTDLAMDVRHRLGMSVLYQPAAVVLHNEGSSHGVEVSDTGSVKHHQVLNKDKFLAKWRAELEGKHLPDRCPQQVLRDRTAAERGGLRVLILDHAVPAPDRDSGSLRISNIIDLLMMKKTTTKKKNEDDGIGGGGGDGIKCVVTLAAEGFKHRETYVERLQQRGVEVLYEPYYKALTDAHNAHQDFDIIYICRVGVFKAFYEEARRLYPDAIVVFDTVDLQFLREARGAEVDGRQLDPAAQETELSFIRQADWSVVVSSYEYDLLSKQHDIPSSKLIKLSNVHEIEPSRPGFSQRSHMIFIAHYHHAPNRDAIEWYVKEVHWRVREKIPEAVIKVVGDAAEVLPSWIKQTPGVEVIGHVPDIRAIYDEVKLTVAPLRWGAGVKGKVSHSLAIGVPVVATPVATEGMELTDGEDVLVASAPEEFAEKVAMLWRSEELWRRLRDNGFKRVEALFSRRAAQEALRPILESARARRAGRHIASCISER